MNSGSFMSFYVFVHCIQVIECEELTYWKRPWCWEWLGAGEEGDDRGWEGWMASLTRWTCVSELWELVMDREAWRAVIHGVASRTWLSDWSDLIWSEEEMEADLKGTNFKYEHFVSLKTICCLLCLQRRCFWLECLYRVLRQGPNCFVTLSQLFSC